MKSEFTLTELAQKIEADEKARKDYIVPTDKMWMDSNYTLKDEDWKNPVISFEGMEFTPNDVGHEQIGSKLGIPKKYYDKMLSEQPELLATNVNCWFRSQPERRLVRTLGPTMRAFLSDKYRYPLSNYLVAKAAFPELMEQGVEVKSCAITERRLYIQAVTPQATGRGKGRRYDTGWDRAEQQ